jgi:EmrB/QacA subfamily drug resistance transporter
VGSALFMQFVDSTALSTAVPTLAREFHSDPVHLRLILTAYIVVQALFLPASGWAADRFGSRRVFMAAMLTFLAGSVLCGLSRSLLQLVMARAVQGLGGSMMMPVGRIIVIGSSPRHMLVQAMMWLSLPATIGPIMGPPLAGFILSVANWPWIFFVNVPVGVLGLLAVLRFVPKGNQPHPGSFDFAGFLISGVVIAAVMTIVEAAGQNGRLQIAAGLVAAPAALAYVLHARRRAQGGRRPVLDLTLLRHKTYRASVTGGALVRLSMGGNPYLLALLLQVGLGWSPLRAGSVVIASSCGAFCSRFLGPRSVRAVGFRNLLIYTAMAVAVLGCLPGFFRPSTPVWLMVVILGVTGFFRAAQVSTSSALAYADVPDDQISVASTLSAVAQQITLSLGITMAGLTLELARGSRPHLQLSDFNVAFTAVSLVTLLAVPIFWRLHPSAGEELSGRKRL